MAIVIKGVTVPALMVKLDKDLSIDANIAELEDKLSSVFFRGAIAAIDSKDSHITPEDKLRLEEVLSKYDTKFLGYKTSDLEGKEVRKPLNEIREKKSLEVWNKTLRSGQKIEQDGDVLIMGDVNPGSYVIASGNVIVMGTLRGIVHAGASGDENTVVMALKLRPQQLRIGSYITRSPDEPEQTDEPEYPEKAYVRDSQIFIEKIQT